MPVNSSNSDIFKNFNLPPQEAINFLKNKAPEISYDWHDVYREAHVKAFTVAGLVKLDVLQDVQNALIEAQEKGQSLETFKQNFLSLLKKKGWYGEQTVKRPDGSVKKVNVSSPWRVKTIYRTNMATAAMAGMYKELETMADIMPCWRYVTVGDGRVREEHARIHGRILRHDDPFWDKYFPPNGYNCRCRVEALSEEEMKKMGLKVSDGRSMGYEVMPFVGTGWDYNPGKEYYTPDPKDYPEEFKPIAEKITKEAEKALEKLPEKEDSVTERNSTQPSVLENNFEKSEKSDKINKELVSGARITDLKSDQADEFATKYYGLVRSFSTDVAKIARNTGESEDLIKQIKNYLFIEERFDEDFGVWKPFDPDCAIAHSWQRLIEGKNIQHHDLLLIQHEKYEMELKKNNPGISHLKAHSLATHKYNYDKASEDYYDGLKKHKNE